jgi:hypothetical protein
MRYWFGAVVVGLFPAISFAGDGGYAVPLQPTWLTDYQQARLIARASHKPVFVVFRCMH